MKKKSRGLLGLRRWTVALDKTGRQQKKKKVPFFYFPIPIFFVSYILVNCIRVYIYNSFKTTIHLFMTKSREILEISNTEVKGTVT